jgi:hypothetical protein
MTPGKTPMGKTNEEHIYYGDLKEKPQHILQVSYNQLISSWAASFPLKYETTLT